MKISSLRGTFLLTTALALICAAPCAYSYTDTDTYYPALTNSYTDEVDPVVVDTLDIQKQGSVTYVTGGVGDEERAVFTRIRRDYNLHLISSGRDGGFTGDTSVRIYDNTGKEVLNAVGGPLFYAQLPKGKYTIQLVNEGIEQKKSVNVSGNNSKDVHFVWN